MAAKRRFEFVDGTSSKFWEITVEGASMSVCFGRIGTAGSAKDKTFPSPAEAKREAEKLVSEKTKKGYVEVGASAKPKPAAAKSAAKPVAASAPPPGAKAARATTPAVSNDAVGAMLEAIGTGALS
jgi:predicted DNA-binding WGR domain protein